MTFFVSLFLPIVFSQCNFFVLLPFNPTNQSCFEKAVSEARKSQGIAKSATPKGLEALTEVDIS